MPCTAVTMVLKALVLFTLTHLHTYVHTYIHTYVQSFCCRRCKQLASVSSSSWRFVASVWWWCADVLHDKLPMRYLHTTTPIYAKWSSFDVVVIVDDEDIAFNCWWLLILWWWIACGCVCVAIDVWIFWWVSHLVNGFTICMQVFSSFLHYERYSHTYFHSNMEISGSAHGVKICGIC